MDNKYNITSTRQIDIIKLNFNLINKHVGDSIEFNKNNQVSDKSIKIMDIGCSLGLNSVIQASSIIGHIRDNLKIKTLIEVYHADQEINDFTNLFLCINNSDQTYLKKWENVYPYAIGKDFMKPLAPPNSIDFIYSYFTLHWAERNEKVLKDNNLYLCTSLHNASIKEYSKQRLNKILKQRHTELKPGGLLICNLVSNYTDQSLLRFQESFKNIKLIFRGMANENILSHQEVDKMHFPILLLPNDIVENEINNTGFQILEKRMQSFDWGSDDIKDETETAIQFVDSVLSFCGPSMKISIKSNQEQIFNQFVDRFYTSFKSNPLLYRFKTETIFLILKKQ